MYFLSIVKQFWNLIVFKARYADKTTLTLLYLWSSMFAQDLFYHLFSYLLPCKTEKKAILRRSITTRFQANWIDRSTGKGSQVRIKHFFSFECVLSSANCFTEQGANQIIREKSFDRTNRISLYVYFKPTTTYIWTNRRIQ